MLVVVGLPLEVKNKLYNCAAILFNGEILGIVPKTYIPNYHEFYEARHFASAPQENIDIRFDNDEYVPFGSANTAFPEASVCIVYSPIVTSTPAIALLPSFTVTVTNPISADLDITFKLSICAFVLFV